MNRNRLSRLAHSAVSSAVNLLSNAFAGLGRTLLFVSLAVMGTAWSIPAARAQVSLAGIQTVLGSGFSNPLGVAVDAKGDVFVTDAGNNAVKEILAVNGVIPADNPTIEVLGSGFNGPAGLALDSAGNVYVADAGNNAVKEILAVDGSIPTNPTIATLGSGFSNPMGVAVDAKGDVFVADTNNSLVKEILAVNGSIPANPTINSLGSGFGAPYGVAVDASGDVFVGDTGSYAVEEILAVNGSIPANPTINTLGNGLFFDPLGVAVDGSGNVYVADAYYGADEFLAASGYSNVGALGGGFNNPQGVAVDASGDVYIADSGNNRVVELNLGPVNFGSEKVCPPGLTAPVPCGNTVTLVYNVGLYNYETGNQIGGQNVLTASTPGLDFQPAADDDSPCIDLLYQTVLLSGCTVDVTFAPIAPGQRSGAVEILNVDGNILATTKIYGTGVGPAITFQPGTQTTLGSGFEAPSSVAVDGSGNIFVVDVNGVSERLAEGGYTTVIPLVALNNRPDTPPFPSGVALDGSGDVFLADGPDSFVSELLAVNGDVPPNQQLIFLGGSYMFPGGVAVDAKGNVFVANSGFSAVQEILAVNGSIPANPTIETLGSGFSNPGGVALDAKGDVFVADTSNSLVKEILAVNGSIPANPTINTLGSGFKNPSGVAVDAAGDVFVADQGNGEVKEMLAVNGSIPANPTIVALGEHFSGPAGLAVDGSGNVYVADGSKNRIEKLDFADPPTFTFASTAVARASSSKSVRFQNVGTTTLTGSGVLSDTADFTVVHGPGIVPDCTASTLVLAPGAECNLSIAFTPQSAGLMSATLTLSDNSLNGHPATQTIQLTGTGHHATQTIDFPTIATQTALTPLDHLYATASSGLPVTFTSKTPTVCTVTGIRADFLTAGSCDVIATQAGNAEYFAAITGQTFLVRHRRQVIIFDPIAAQPVGTMLTLTATTDSELPITYASTTPTVCTLSGSTASLLNTGTCTIQASQAGDATYFHSGPVTVSFTVE